MVEDEAEEARIARRTRRELGVNLRCWVFVLVLVLVLVMGLNERNSCEEEEEPKWIDLPMAAAAIFFVLF